MEDKFCLCGCGERVKNNYVHGHNTRGLKHPHRSEEHKRKISESNKGRLLGIPRPEEVRKKISKGLTGKKLSPETIAKRTESRRKTDNYRAPNKGVPVTEEQRKKMSEITRQLHKDGVFLNSYGGNNKVSKVELSIKEELEPLGYVHTLDKKYHIGTPGVRVRIPDYVNSKERKVLEVWGTYWHKDDDPQEMIDWYKDHGWDCTVIWETQIKNGKIIS